MVRKKKDSVSFLPQLISRILDPIVVIPMVLAYAVWVALVNGERIRFLLFVLGVDVILPGFVLLYFVQKDIIRSGWDVRLRQERIPIFMFVGLAHGITVMAAWFLGIQPLASYLFSFWILIVAYILITFFWKISVHVGVLSAVSIYVVTHSGVEYVWLFSLVLLMIWARVKGKYHDLSQAVAGALTPVIILPICFGYFGLIPT